MRKLSVIIIGLVILILIPYLFSPVYDFPETKQFAGNFIYNPYQNIDSTKWRKANFHTHAKNIFGRISETKNIVEKIYDTYKKLGYDVIGISDYQNIQYSELGNQHFQSIPSYEHGYGVQKVHQLCVGTHSVLWLDYLFYQSINQKQYILNLLKNRSKLVSLNHPRCRNAYSAEELKKLTNYDCIEVLNHRWFSIKLWDATLSSGHIAFILGDDDAHIITNPAEVGICCNFVNSESLKEDDIINAVKSGKSFGADIYMGSDWTFDKKAEEAKKMPVINKIQVINNKLIIRLSEKAKKISFIGQGGNIMKSIHQTECPFYDIMPSDTYIRTEITFNSGTVYYLNPVFKYNGVTHVNKVAVINPAKTFIYRSSLVIILLGLMGLMIRRWKLRTMNNEQ